MAAPENIANTSVIGEVAALTSLSAECTSGATTIQVTSKPPATLEAAGQFHIIVGKEIMLVTGGQTTTTWTVSRAQENTTAEAYATGTSIFNYLTAAALKSLIGESELVKTAGLANEAVTEAKIKAKSISDTLVATNRALVTTNNAYGAFTERAAATEFEASSTRMAQVMLTIQIKVASFVVVKAGGVKIAEVGGAEFMSIDFLLPPGKKWIAEPALSITKLWSNYLLL
jgi:hypothetical protein